MSERIKYIDVAKGILICCLIWGHMSIISRYYGLDDKILHGVNATIRLYGTFFMQTFFIITGLCSSFTNIPFGQYLWKNIKTLVLPAIFIAFLVDVFKLPFVGWHSDGVGILMGIKDWFLINGPWFIWALFYAKLLFYGIAKLRTRYQLAIVVSLYVFGFVLHEVDVLPNYLWHQHTLLMMPYLWLGYFLKGKMDKIDKYLYPVGMFGAVSIFLQNTIKILYGYPMPSHTWWIGLEWWTIPIHVINIISGTAFIFWLSKKLQNVNFMSVIGGGTLLVYLLDEPIRRLFITSMLHVWHPIALWEWALFHAFQYGASIVVFYLLIRLVYNRKYLSWIVGKW